MSKDVESFLLGRRGVLWRAEHLFHHVVVHPLLPLAELLDDFGRHDLSDAICKLHDLTAPDGDEQRLRSR